MSSLRGLIFFDFQQIQAFTGVPQSKKLLQGSSAKQLNFAPLNFQGEGQPKLECSSPEKREGEKKSMEAVEQTEKEEGQEGEPKPRHTFPTIAME